MEYCPNGNLRDFLRSNRNLYNVDEQSLMADISEAFGPKDLVYMAWQIAKGMTFLISRKVRKPTIKNMFVRKITYFKQNV
jgi:serine/threonine protein kinase